MRPAGHDLTQAHRSVRPRPRREIILLFPTAFGYETGAMNNPPVRRHFASDNYAGICPEAWAALAEANQGHAISYGDDPWTAKAADLIREVFEMDCEVFFVFNGTAANSLSLAATGQ